MSNKVYDSLKLAVICLTALCTLILTVGKAFMIPYYEPISIAFGACATALQYILNEVSKEFFKDKNIVPKENDFEVNEPLG